jgi:nitroimidazol reductase NimA-like FMN-containing flavoprotein (pyridoxamine 5'-phosphate oxidase superfamily)
VPISYGYDGRNIYSHTEEGLKLNLMRRNPRVCFEVDDINMVNMANWKSVIAWGEFEEITDPVEREKALHILLDRKLPLAVSNTVRLTSDWPFCPIDVNEIAGIVFRINITKKTGRFEKSN